MPCPAPTYFEHNERKHAPRVVEVPVVECDGMLVSEQRITSEEFRALVRKHFGDSSTPVRTTE